MGKIFYVMGKSSSGKDTIYKSILDRMQSKKNIKTLTIYTTRPMRAGESQGKEYHFVNESTWNELNKAGKIIESRIYKRVQDEVKYFTVDDENINLHDINYIGIGTLESYEQMCNYYGAEIMTPIYIQVEDGQRLLRAIERESQQEKEIQNFKEICRRYIADEDDFSQEKLEQLKIQPRFENKILEECTNIILEYIESKI